MSAIRPWICRYVPGEILGTLSAIMGSSLGFMVTRNNVFAAYFGSLSENIGFYGYMFYLQITTSRKYGFSRILESIKYIVLEFGFSECLDSFLVRPLCLFIFPLLIGNYVIGIVVGKVVADVAFYIPAAISCKVNKIKVNE